MLPFPKNDVDAVTRETVRELLNQPVETAISIYVPTYYNDNEQGPIRLKNLLNQAEATLIQERGMRSPTAISLLAPVRAFTDEAMREFWHNRASGVAFFLSEDFMRVYRLNIDIPELVVVNNRFHVKPLQPLLNPAGEFYVLGLDFGGVKLWKAGAYHWEEIPLTNTPLTLEESMRFYEFSQESQFHTNTSPNSPGGGHPAVYHGSGSPGDRKAQDVLNFFREVNEGVLKAIGSDNLPLVLVGHPREQGQYREANHYPHLLPTGVNITLGDLTSKEMHSLAWEVVKPVYTQEEAQFMDDYRRLRGNNDPLAINDLEAVVKAAYYHQIVALFVREDTAIWGQFDPETNTITQHETREEGDEDLIDFAITHTLLNAGRIYRGSPEADTPLAAILRFVM